MIATFLICRRLEGDSYVRSFVEDLRVDSYVPHLSKILRVIATFLICRRLEGDSYVPHLSKA